MAEKRIIRFLRVKLQSETSHRRFDASLIFATLNKVARSSFLRGRHCQEMRSR